MIGKNKHMQITLNDTIESMTSEQKETYTNVLAELRQKGWRVLKCKYINIQDQSNGATQASESSS